MIDPDEVPEEWRVESDRHPNGWDWENPDEGWDDSDRHWQWVQEPASHAGQAAPAPWYRGPKLLLGLIGLAAATLVVATALLVGGRFSGEIPTSRQLDSRTATPAPRTTASSTAEAQPTSTTSRSTEPTESTESTTASSEPAPTVDQAPEPIGTPTPPAAPAPSQPAPKAPDGPRINVTRTPMSFTPSVSARP